MTDGQIEKLLDCAGLLRYNQLRRDNWQRNYHLLNKDGKRIADIEIRDSNLALNSIGISILQVLA